MKFSYWNSCFLVLILLAQTVVLTSTQEQEPPVCNPLCKTGLCEANGTCRCLQPAADHLYFLGGQFCDQPSHYCSSVPDPTFWCADNDNVTTCGTLSDGSPTCICHPGHAGANCEFNGTVCGVGYCYNNATCLDGATCDCPPEWQGNANCSLASSEDSSSSGSGIKWWGALLITVTVVAVVSAGVVFGVKKYKERMEGVSRFDELKKSQMRGRAESDDDEYDSDPYEDEVAKKSTKTAQPQP